MGWWVRQEDRGDIRQTIAEMQASPSEREALLLRRAVLAEAAPVLSLNLPAALRAAFAAAAQHHSETALIEVRTALCGFPLASWVGRALSRVSARATDVQRRS